MPIQMKPLKDFRGRPGEGRDRIVEAGVEITVADERRAQELEARGLAVPLHQQKAEQRPLNKMEPPLANKAASDGPLGSPGGATGAGTPRSSLPPVRPQRVSRSKRGEDGFDI